MNYSRALSLIAIFSVAGLAFGAHSDLTQTTKSFYSHRNLLTTKIDLAGLVELWTDHATPDFVYFDMPGKSGRRSKSNSTLVGFS